MAQATIHDVYIELERIEVLLRLLIIKMQPNTDEQAATNMAEIEAVLAALDTAHKLRD